MSTLTDCPPAVPAPSTSNGSGESHRVAYSTRARDAVTQRRPIVARLRASSVELRSPRGAAGVGLALGLWIFIIADSAPGRIWSTAQEARCYWVAALADPYRWSVWTRPLAYVYSPAFLQFIAPLKALGWPAFVAVWTALLLVALRYLTGPRLFWLGVLVAAIELAGGNISLFLAVAIVLGFRWPATWAFVVLTKVTPGVGLLWFVLRREWRNLVVALGATIAVVGASTLLAPHEWWQWLQVLVANAGQGGTSAAVPLALWVRLPIAVALLAWGARTDRRWTVAVASMLALPALWFGSLSMLLAVIPLSGRAEFATSRECRADRRDGEPSGNAPGLLRRASARAMIEERG